MSAFVALSRLLPFPKRKTSEKHSLTSDKQSLTSEKQSLTSEKQSLTSDKQSLTSEYIHSFTGNVCILKSINAFELKDITQKTKEMQMLCKIIF